MSQDRGGAWTSRPLAIRRSQLDSRPSFAVSGRGPGRAGWPGWGLMLLVSVWGCGVATTLSAADPTIAEVSIGLGGKFKVGYWTPVRITIQGGDADFTGQVELTLPDSDDVSARFVQATPETFLVPAGGQWVGWRYMKLGKIRGTMKVGLRRADGVPVCEQTIGDISPEPATWQWVVTAGPDVGVEQAAVFVARVRGEKLMTSQLQQVDQFPDRWFGYEGVDVVILSTGEVNPAEKLSDAQYTALLRWLQLGGRLVFSAGRRAPELFRESHPFFPLRPGTWEEIDKYWKASGLENWTRAAERLTSNDESPLAVFKDLRGTVACVEGTGGANDRALVVQYPVGFGEVTYVALDLEQAPLAHWPARPRLIARLLQTRSEEEDSAIGSEGLGQVTHLGYDDIAGQLRSALDQYSHVTLVRFSWIAGILVLYILLLGPLDFFGLHRLGRPHWTWVTFPLTVIAFCLLAIWLSQRWKGNRVEVNQMDVVDVDVAQGTLRGTTWANVYSPRATRLDVNLAPQPAVSATQPPEVLLSWNGLPGAGLGGMNSSAAVDVLGDKFTYTIRYDSATESPRPAAVTGLPLQTSATKGLIARWWSTTAELPPSDLHRSDGGTLSGVVVNPLDVELSHCRVYYDNWAYPVEGRLGPGESCDLEFVTPLDLKWQLTRRRVVESTDISSPWDRADLTDPMRITEMLMFYGAAGGRAYTRLTHSYQGFVDLSRHLRTGQAVLVGRSKQPASVLTCDQPAQSGNTDQHWTYYRVSIPVRREAAGGRPEAEGRR